MESNKGKVMTLEKAVSIVKGASKSTVEEIKNKISDLENEIEDLEDELSILNGKKEDLEYDLEEIDDANKYGGKAELDEAKEMVLEAKIEAERIHNALNSGTIKNTELVVEQLEEFENKLKGV